MDEMDDFGDVYADVDVDVNDDVESFDRVYIGGDVNDGNLKWVFNLNSQKKDVELDSDSDELILYDQIRNTNGVEEKAREEDSKTLASGAGNENNQNMNFEDGSESEDDLHIVLNDDDSLVFPISRPMGAGDGKRAGGSDDEDDDDDDLVIVTEADHPSKDRRPIDGLEQSMGGPAAESGNASMGAYASQYSQFKYVRPHAAAPSNFKTSGSAGVVSLSFPASGRHDWDVDGGNQTTISCSGLDTPACNLGIHAVSQKRFDFRLPRNKTILDVNIESFEWKPWRHPGADMTDYFNFGLDEESWKSYCKSLEHFRQQITMLTKIPVYQSSRPHQASEDEFLQKTVGSEARGRDITQTDQGDRVSSLAENVNWSARGFEIPKGRTIQVEGGIGERLPSIDVRRPRYRDSDVVIQIPMQVTTVESYVSNDKEPEHVDESSANMCENGGPILEDNQSTEHHGSVLGVIVGHHHQNVIKSVSKETDEDLETTDGRDTENHSQVGKETLDADTASCDQIQCNLSPSNLQSHSEASKAGVSVDMGKAYNNVKRPSSSSLTGSAPHQSTDTRIDTSKTEYKDNNNSSPEQSPIQNKRNNTGRLRFCGVTQSEIPMNNTKVSIPADEKGWHNGHQKRQATRKGRWHSYDFDDNDSIENECYYRETEISIGRRGRRFVEKQERRDSYTELIHRKDEPHFQEERGLYMKRDLDERGYFDERVTERDDKMKQREFYFRERGYSDGGMSAVTHKEYDLLISDNASFHVEKEKCLRLRRKNEIDRRFSKVGEDDDFMFEHRYREESIQGKYGRHMLNYGTEDDLIQKKYRRRVPVLSREKVRSDRRERDALSPSLGLDGSWRAVEYNGKHRRNPGHKPLFSETFREVHIEDGRGWHDCNSPSNHAHDSWRPNIRFEDNWRSNERCTDHLRSEEKYPDHWRMPDLHDKQFNKHREESYIFSRGKEHHYRSRQRRDIDFDMDSYRSGEVDVYPNMDVFDERRRYRHLWTDEEASFGHQEQDGSYGPILDRGSRHEQSHLDHDSAHDRKHLDDFQLGRSREKITVGKSVHSKASKYISSTSDIADWGKRKSTALRCKETVDSNLNDWEIKYHQRCSEAEVRGSRYDNTACADNGEWMALRHSDEVTTSKAAPARMLKVENKCSHGISSKVEKVGCLEQSADVNDEKWLDKFPVVKHEDDMELEEGQLLEEPENKEDFNQSREQVSEIIAPSLSVEVSQYGSTVIKSKAKDAANDNKDVRGFDNNRILEMLAKMERRRERFKEPIALKKDPDRSLLIQAESNPDETLAVKQQRPARKRRWGGL